MNFTSDGLSLWYGTPDAPAPLDEVVPRRKASLVVGVHPANPTNAVHVRYRVDGGIVQTAPGRELRTESARDAQYFLVTFPPFPAGDLVEYCPVLTCGGRQVPPPHIANRFPSRFRFDGKESRPAAQWVRPRVESPHRFSAGLEFVGTVAVEFGPPQFLGETAAGMRVNFFVKRGVVEGKGFRAKVTEGSADEMIVRRDGMGVIRIRAAFATEDGAMLDVESGGYVDFGADGYRKAVAHRLPDRCPLVVNPLIATRHPRYAWLSRIQCIGVGETHLDAGRATYHVYAVSPQGVTLTQ